MTVCFQDRRRRRRRRRHQRRYRQTSASAKGAQTADNIPRPARILYQGGQRGLPRGTAAGGLFEPELSERAQRRIQRHLAAAKPPQGKTQGPPQGKTLDSFDFPVVPTVSKARVNAPAEGDRWLQAGHNLRAFGLRAFGPPGVGKTHIAAAIGHELVQRGHRVLMTPRVDDKDIRSRAAAAGRALKPQPRAGNPKAGQV